MVVMSISNIDNSNENAAFLLMRVRQIALDEVRAENVTSPALICSPLQPPKTLWNAAKKVQVLDQFVQNPTTVSSSRASVVVSPTIQFDVPNIVNTAPSNRCRTVSFCSSSDGEDYLAQPIKKGMFLSRIPMMPRLPLQSISGTTSNSRVFGSSDFTDSIMNEDAVNFVEVSSDHSVASVSSVDKNKIELVRPESVMVETVKKPKTAPNQEQSDINTSNLQFVGTTVDGSTKVRDVLRKKFSWKSFPELERYLINNRAQYLEFSNELNYTAEQKRYNNLLTQGLLDLAAEEGYIFDGFTFAAVRDRIRCYYKSYVQAAKKKKLKSKRHGSTK